MLLEILQVIVNWFHIATFTIPTGRAIGPTLGFHYSIVFMMFRNSCQDPQIPWLPRNHISHPCPQFKWPASVSITAPSMFNKQKALDHLQCLDTRHKRFSNTTLASLLTDRTKEVLAIYSVISAGFNRLWLHGKKRWRYLITNNRTWAGHAILQVFALRVILRQVSVFLVDISPCMVISRNGQWRKDVDI